jgi:uncharacterized protein
LIYLDSSALVKMALTEAESAALADWLADRPNLVRVSSPLARVEVPRAVWRAEPSALPEAYRVTQRITPVLLTEEVLNRAATTRPPTLSSPDAIHLASALLIRQELTTFVAYDKRLLDAAKDAGLETARPA